MSDHELYWQAVVRGDLRRLGRIGNVTFFWMSWRTWYLPWRIVPVITPDHEQIGAWLLCGSFGILRFVSSARSGVVTGEQPEMPPTESEHPYGSHRYGSWKRRVAAALAERDAESGV